MTFNLNCVLQDREFVDMDLPFNGVGIGGNNKVNKRQSDSFPPSPTNSEVTGCLPCCCGNKDKEASQVSKIGG